MSQYPGQYSSQMNPQNANVGSGQPNYNPQQGSMAAQNPWGSPSYGNALWQYVAYDFIAVRRYDCGLTWSAEF